MLKAVVQSIPTYAMSKIFTEVFLEKAKNFIGKVENLFVEQKVMVVLAVDLLYLSIKHGECCQTLNLFLLDPSKQDTSLGFQ